MLQAARWQTFEVLDAFIFQLVIAKGTLLSRLGKNIINSVSSILSDSVTCIVIFSQSLAELLIECYTPLQCLLLTRICIYWLWAFIEDSLLESHCFKFLVMLHLMLGPLFECRLFRLYVESDERVPHSVDRCFIIDVVGVLELLYGSELREDWTNALLEVLFEE